MSPPLPLNLDVVVCLYNLNEVLGMLIIDVFDAKIVDYKGEADGAPFMRPKSRCEFALVITVLGQTLL